MIEPIEKSNKDSTPKATIDSRNKKQKKNKRTASRHSQDKQSVASSLGIKSADDGKKKIN